MGEGSVWKFDLQTEETSVVLPAGSVVIFWGVLSNGNLVVGSEQGTEIFDPDGNRVGDAAPPGDLYWAPGHDRFALATGSTMLSVYVDGQWAAVSGLPEHVRFAMCTWSSDLSQLAVVTSTNPATPADPIPTYLFLVSTAEGSPPSIDSWIQPPPGYSLASRSAGWIGSSQLLVTLVTDNGEWETWT